jgi:hypothetical protein
VAGSCECGNEPSSSIKCGEFCSSSSSIRFLEVSLRAAIICRLCKF